MRCAVASLVFLASVAFAQNDSSLTLSGTVIDANSGEPIPRALVTLNGSGTNSTGSPSQRFIPVNRSLMADSRGEFRFVGLSAGNFRVTAAKPGYAASLAPTARNQFVKLERPLDGQQVKLQPLGSITGKVTDQYDEPMRGVFIGACGIQVTDGLRQCPEVRTVQTNDLGEYRLWNLSPGKYHLRAQGQAGNPVLSSADFGSRPELGDTFAPTYAGGSPSMSGAQPVEIGAGGHGAADFRLKLEPAFRISGTIRGFAPRQPLTMQLTSGTEVLNVGPDRFNGETGAFEIHDVPAGVWTLRVMQGDSAGDVSFTLAPPGPAEVQVNLAPPVDIPVSIRVPDSPSLVPDGDRDDPDDLRARTGAACNVRLRAEGEASVLNRPARQVISRRGVLPGVSPGRYRTFIECYGGYAQSALAGTQDLFANPVVTVLPDASPVPIDVLAAQSGIHLTGKLADGAGPSAQAVSVLLIPEFASAGPVVSMAAQGAEFFGLAPGRYTLYAFAHSDIEYRDPAFLRSLSGGKSITVGDAASQEVIIDRVLP